ncbi:hypothetical protein D3C75_1232110 [compost metagenome]
MGQQRGEVRHTYAQAAQMLDGRQVILARQFGIEAAAVLGAEHFSDEQATGWQVDHHQLHAPGFERITQIL